MFPVLHLLGQTVSTYSLLMIVASSVFVWGFWRIAVPEVGSPWAWVLDTWPVLLTALAGARLVYGLAHLDYFSEQPLQLFLPWTEGLAFHGGLLAGGLALAVLPERWLPQDTSILHRLRLADATAWALSLAAIPAWLALLSIGGAWGRAVALRSAPGVVVLPDLYGLRAPRYPVQALAVMASLAVSILLWFLYHSSRYRPGLLLAVYSIAYLGSQFALDFLRADPAPVWQGWRASQWIDAGGVILGLAWLVGPMVVGRMHPILDKGQRKTET